MTKAGHNFPPPDALPIPEDVQVDAGWPAQLVEMADHIGAYATLLIVERLGGQYVYVPKDPAHGPFRAFLSSATAAELSRVYGGERLAIPTGRKLLPRVRRAPIIAKVRRKEITGAEAQRILGTSRSYLSHIVNATDEAADEGAPSIGAGRRHAGQFDLFGEGPD